MKILILLTFLPLLAYADPDCDYEITLGNFTAAIQDVAQVIPQTLSLRREGNSNNCETYELYFGKGQANSYQRMAYSNGYSIPYNLYRTVSLGTVLKDYGDAGINEFLTGTVMRDSTVNATWYVEVKSKDNIFNVPPGTYTDTLPVRAYNLRNSGVSDFQTARWMTLSFIIPRYAEVSVVPVNGPHNSSSTVYIMDFGEMQPQQELQADLVVKANVPYGMNISSQNGGFLQKTPATTNVPYQIKVGNGNWVTPPTYPYWLGQESSGSPQNGRRYNLRVKLGNFTNLDDGDYQETVTITVTAY
ncbi:MAG: spore coat protein U domain-containing protein [Bacteriovoracaceae bacterium]|nr:spore coat protein U domain-containing protein [Bacteriovoracaceae bacterium]